VGQLTEAISLVGKGVTKSKHLSSDQASAAMACILTGQADPLELGAFLVAMRIKEETAEELTAFVREAQRTLTPVSISADLTISSYAGKRQTFAALIPAACVLAELGVKVGIHGHATPPGRISLQDVLAALGKGTPGSVSTAGDDLARAGVAYVGVEAFSPIMYQMLDLRRKLGVRTCFQTMARLVNPFAAPTQMVGLSHARTFEKFSVASHALGYERVVSFRGMEGEAEPNPLTATTGYQLDAAGSVSEFAIDPAALGIAKDSRNQLMADSPDAAAALVRQTLAGQGPSIAREAVALTAATGLLAAGRKTDLAAALTVARQTLASNGPQNVLARWIGP